MLGQWKLPASAGLCNHILILLVQYASIALNHEDTYGAVAVGHTGGSGHIGIYKLMNKALHHSMVGCMVVIAE